MRVVVVAVYVAMVLPVFPLAFGWYAALRPAAGPRSGVDRIGLPLATLSYLWLVAIILFGGFVAPDYSRLRFNAIYVNIAGALTGTIVGVLREARAKAALVATFGLLFVLWCYMAAVSSVV